MTNRRLTVALVVAIVLCAASFAVAQLGSVSLGSLIVNGPSGGVITIQPQSSAGTYNFNLPTTAGTAGQVLTSQGGGSTAMTWTTPSGGGGGSSVMARVTHNASQTVAASTNAALALNTALQNPDSLWSSGSNTRLTNNTGSTKTCMITGTAYVTWSSAGAAHQSGAAIYLNGSIILDAQMTFQPSGSSGAHYNVTAIRRLANSDSVELQMRNQSSATATIGNSPGSDEYSPILSMVCQ